MTDREGKEETWKERHDREYAAYISKANKAWETKYKKLTPSRKTKEGGSLTLEFEDWTKETDEERRVKTTTFRLSKGDVEGMWVNVSRQQKFLCVNGPQAGKRLVNADEEYVLYNCAEYNRGTSKEAAKPRCVLVHRTSFAGHS